jgi:glycosyltransferase 2 family protein
MTTVAPAPRPRANARTAVLVVVGVALSVAAAWVAIQGVDLAATAAIVGGADLAWLLGVVGIIGSQVLIRSIRWRMILPVQPGHTIAVRRIVPVYLVGYLANTVLPARLGEGVRAVLLARREGLPMPDTIGSVVLERLLDILTVAILGATAALALGAKGQTLIVALVGLAVAGAALVAVAIAARFLRRSHWGRLDRARAIVGGLLSGASPAGRAPVIARAIVLTVITWLLDAGIYWLVARSLGLDLTPVAAMIISTVAVLSTAIPAAPGYVGTFELAATGALRALGVDAETSLAVAIVTHAVVILTTAVGGTIAAVAIARDGLPVSDAAPAAPAPRQTSVRDPL